MPIQSPPGEPVTVSTAANLSFLRPVAAPEQGVAVAIRRFTRNATRRRIVNDPAGQKEAIVVSDDTEGADRGTLSFRVRRSADAEAVRRLLNRADTLVVTIPAPAGEQVGEIVYFQATSDVEEEHDADGVLLGDRTLSVTWVEVAP